MIPTLDNLDQWLFDSFEGNLSPEQQELLDNFLAQHPDLSLEQDAWEQAAFVANPITFEPKSALYRKKEWNYKPFAAAALLLLLFGASYFYTSSNKNTAKQVQQAKASSKTTRQSSSKTFNSSSYLSQSCIGFLATPDSIAAFATAGATVVINLGSKGFGII